MPNTIDHKASVFSVGVPDCSKASRAAWAAASGVQVAKPRNSGKFGVRADDAFDGVQYQARFATRPGAWIDVELPVAAFQPTFRGRAVDAPALDPARIRVFGFLISERQAGPFRLVVESIRARF